MPDAPRPRAYQRALKAIRVSVSAACLILCLAFAALWARSYWRFDHVTVRLAGHNVFAASTCGQWRIIARKHPEGLARQFSAQRLEELGARWITLRLTFPGQPPLIDTRLVSLTWTSTHKIVWMKYWLSTYLLAALAAAPWLTWPPRFGVKTLLIVSTLVAVAAAIVASTERPRF